MLIQSAFRIVCRFATIERIFARKSESIQFGEENLLGL